MGPDMGVGESLIPLDEAVRCKMSINYREKGLYHLKDASNNFMNVIGTVRLHTFPRGHCDILHEW